METERVNRLQELSKGSEILNTDPPSINLAELMRQTDKEIQPKTWEIYIRKKIGTDIEIIKKFTWDEQGGKVSVVDRRGNELKTSQYSFQDGEMNLGEGYLQVEMPHDYRSYIEDIEMTGLDHYGRPSTSPGLAEEFDSWMSEVKSAEPQPSEFVQPESQEIQQSGSEELQNALFENEKLTSEIEERDRQLSAKDQQIAGLQKELNESNAKINNLEVAVKGLQDQMAEQTRQAEEERKKQEERLQILVEDALAKEREKDGEESENPDNLPEPESPISVQTESEVSSEAIDEQVPDEGSKPQELSPGEVVILGKLADIEGNVNSLSGRVDNQQKQLDEMPSKMADLVTVKASEPESDNGTSHPELVPSPEPALVTSVVGGNGVSGIDSDIPVPEPVGVAVAVAAREPVGNPVFPGSDPLANVEPTMNGSENGRLENGNGSGRNKRGWFVSSKDGLTKRDRPIEGNGSTNDKVETKARTLAPRRVVVVDRNTVAIPGELSKYITPANVNKILGNGKVTATEAEEQFRKLAASKAVKSGQEWDEEVLAEELAGIKVSIPVSANR